MGWKFKIGEDGVIRRSLVIETLGDHAENQAHHAWCDDCGHNKPWDLAPHIQQYGPDYPFTRYVMRLVCDRCGSKKVRLVASYTGPGSGRRVS